MASFIVHKHTLSNGLKILTLPRFEIPKVSLQLWYNVGSKDEHSKEKGLAHLIEHMIFKGTTTLSESDINLITHKLSGSCNAFTSHDYTGYMFDMPAQHWDYALPIMADCMVNCTFKEDLLNSELKAVIQELKMYNDDYASTLLEKLITAIFNDHPYHYPVIGYKKDLWSLKRDALVNFYQHHYVPNNAHLVVVGAVKPEDVFRQAERSFGSIEPIPDYQKTTHYHSLDTARQSVTIYRDIQQPHVMIAWEIPGARAKIDYLLDVISWLLGSGKGSRLVHRIVDQEGLATELESFAYDLIEYGLFVVCFEPKQAADIQPIIDIIHEEIERAIKDGFSASEIQRACKKTEMGFISTTEDQERCAYIIGKYFLAHGDENYLNTYLDYPRNTLSQEAQAFVAQHLSPILMHTGTVLPIPACERTRWMALQEISDAEDARVLARVARESVVEDGTCVHTIEVKPPQSFEFPRASDFTLPNGLKVIFHHSSQGPKIDLVVEFKARAYYDPEHKQGLLAFLMDMLDEGTKELPLSTFTTELESYGMSVSALPGQITMSMLSADAHKGFELLYQMLTCASFDQKAIEKVRAQILADINDFWDTPAQFVGQLARDAVYGIHPYHKSYLGTRESIKAITRDELLAAYSQYITPQAATLVLVGDLERYDIKTLIEKALGAWTGPLVEDLSFPALHPIKKSDVIYDINRDQVTLAFAGLSISRLHKDFDKILLFDQILTGGVLGSMSSRLFQIREQTGLFYTIGGSLLAGAYLQPGIMFIKTVVSPDKLKEAEHLITQVMRQGAQTVTQEELDEAKRAVTTALVDNFATNRSMASSFLFLETFKFPPTFFDNRAQQLMSITLPEVQEAVQKLVKTEHMVTINIGRLGKK